MSARRKWPIVRPLARTYEEDYTHKKQSGGSGQFARVIIDVRAARAWRQASQFENKTVGGSVPKEYRPGRAKRPRSRCWVRAFSPASRPSISKRTLTDGAYHDVDSSVMAFEIAARAAFREGMAKAGPKLLEPIMKVEVVTPEDYLGDVIGDLSSSRRGNVQGMDQRGNARVVNALVPLGQMFGYVNNLAFDEPGSCELQHGIRSLRRSTVAHRRRD